MLTKERVRSQTLLDIQLWNSAQVSFVRWQKPQVTYSYPKEESHLKIPPLKTILG